MCNTRDAQICSQIGASTLSSSRRCELRVIDKAARIAGERGVGPEARAKAAELGASVRK